jgi:hypothetical protein
MPNSKQLADRHATRRQNHPEATESGGPCSKVRKFEAGQNTGHPISGQSTFDASVRHYQQSADVHGDVA